MRKTFALFLSAFLCVQTICTMPLKDAAEYEETAEIGTADPEEGQESGTGPGTGLAAETAESTDTLSLAAESAVLMEASSGTVLYEKEADAEKPPASVTKIMTLLLIFDALDSGKIRLEDPVSTSEYAASMGGSQVYLEPGEIQSVDTMIKCISVASANDACVAMAELVSGSEEAFVNAMNERAKGLGMEHTHFVNCNGLDADGHLTTARDIALMSREMITRYPQVHDYCTIWMENITHTTAKGTSEFGLTNTNKLIRQYEYATGLKTGSTSKAKFCLSATAKKNDIDMIAVVMAEPDAKTRVKDAISLLNYGFGRCNVFQDTEILEKNAYADVVRGTKEEVAGTAAEEIFRYIDVSGADLSAIEKKTELYSVKAPVKKGDVIGRVVYSIGQEEIGSVDITAAEAVGKMTYKAAILKVLQEFFT